VVLQIGITGSNSSDRKYQPQTYLHEQCAQDLIAELCQHPIRVAAIDNTLLNNLLLVAAVRVRDGLCYLNFTCFLRRDIEILNERAAELGRSLARAIAGGLDPSVLRSLRHLRYPEDLPRYLFFLVGCVVLDWHGLGILAHRGYTLQPAEMVRPADGNFTIFGNEVYERSLRGLYWGSHNDSYGDYLFTSFGDHDSPRTCLPDLLWAIHAAPLQDLAPACLAVTRDVALSTYATAVARHLMGEETGEEPLQAHLEALHYTAGGIPTGPVFVPQDREALRSFIAVLDERLVRWIDDHNDGMRAAFGLLSPMLQGVAWREVLLQIWHYVFAHANRSLCASGVLFDPYSAGSQFPGYLPVVSHKRCELNSVPID
jgi:hypothetical protein